MESVGTGRVRARKGHGEGAGAHAFLGNVVKARIFMHDTLACCYHLFFRVQHITTSSTTDKWQQH